MPCRGAVQNVVPTATWRPEFGNPLLLVKCIRCETINAVLWTLASCCLFGDYRRFTRTCCPEVRGCLITTHQMVSWPIIHERIHRLLFFSTTTEYFSNCVQFNASVYRSRPNIFFSRTHDSFYKCLHGLGLMTQRDNILSQSAGTSFTSRNSNYTLLQNLQNV